MDFSEFRISEKCGFLLESPATHLPSYFEPWGKLAGDMPNLISQRAVRSKIDQLPVLEIDKLEQLCSSKNETYRAQRLAHLHLTTLISGYVWSQGENNAPKILPKQLAVPMVEVCKKLGGIKPGISHMSSALANYRLIDPSGHLRAVSQTDNMQTISFKFIEDFGNDWYFLNIMQCELDFAPGLAAIFRLMTNKIKDTTTVLKSLTSSIQQMTSTLQKMPLYLSPEVFFHGFRPYLVGFTSGPYENWGGIIFEGVDPHPKGLNTYYIILFGKIHERHPLRLPS